MKFCLFFSIMKHMRKYLFLIPLLNNVYFPISIYYLKPFLHSFLCVRRCNSYITITEYNFFKVPLPYSKFQFLLLLLPMSMFVIKISLSYFVLHLVSCLMQFSFYKVSASHFDIFYSYHSITLFEYISFPVFFPP